METNVTTDVCFRSVHVIFRRVGRLCLRDRQETYPLILIHGRPDWNFVSSYLYFFSGYLFRYRSAVVPEFEMVGDGV